MKKITIFLVMLVLLACLPQFAAANGNIAMTGPSTVRAGDTIAVSFSAGGGILGGSGAVSYDSSLLTLQSYTQVVGGSWQVQFNGNNFLFWDDSMSSPIQGSAVIFKATFQVKSDLAPGTAISISATGVTLSDGTQDMPVGSATYSTQLAAPLSTNCALQSLTLSNATLSPAFSPEITKYSASVPYSVSALQLSAAAADTAAKISIHNPTLAAGTTTTVTVTVTAESGAVRQYTIQVTRAQDPNYIKSSNSTLQNLIAENHLLSPAFSSDIRQYYVWLPYEVSAINLNGTPADSKASVSITSNNKDLKPATGTKIIITVTAEDGSTSEYTVTAVRAPAHEDTEAFLNTERVPEETTPTETFPVTAPTEASPTEPDTPSETPSPQKGISPVVLVIACIICTGIGIAAGFSLQRRR